MEADNPQYDIVLLRLNTGEEVITKMTDKTQLKNPLLIQLHQDAHGKVTASFYPFMANALNATCLLMDNHIQAVAVPDEKLLENYLISIGDKPKIIKPSSEIVLPK